jgi:hypothetical protein
LKGFYIYRYKDITNDEIVYIGKTLQNSVKDRINQHITDPVGVWAKNNPHTIEFIELPREEDMDYIESYLIRKFVPKYNTILADASRVAPFEIIIDENLWKNLNDYLKEKIEQSEKLQGLSKETISSNFLRLQQNEENFNSLFNEKIKNRVTLTDLEFIKNLSSYLEKDGFANVPKQHIYNLYNISTNEELREIFQRLISYKFSFEDTVNAKVEKFTLFCKIVTNSNNSVTFYLGENGQKILKTLLNP